MRALLSVTALGALSVAAADWLMFGNNPQRTGCARNETLISPATVGRLHVAWSLKLANNAKELNALTVPVIVENVITPKGFKDIVLIAGSSDTLFAIDADTGKLLWSRQFHIDVEPRQEPNWLCPNALNATPVIDKTSRSVYVLASDGKLHTLNYVNGEDLQPAIEFVPPFAKAWSLNLFDHTLYTTTSQGCNSVKSAVYTMRLDQRDRTVSNFVAGPNGGAGMWGRAGGAISAKTGLFYAETGDGTYDPASGRYSDTFVAVSREGKLMDYYTPENRAWISKKDLDMGNISPTVFGLDRWELVAGAGKEGVIYLLDAKSLGGADHRTPLYRSPLYTNEDVDFAGRGFWGAFATCQDAKGTRWLYAPAGGPPATGAPEFPIRHGETKTGSIMAFTITAKSDKPVLEPAWTSRDLSVPEPPIVANGVLFALSNGEDVRQVDSAGRLYTSAQRADMATGNAVLYAFDAYTGKQLYSSADAIRAFTHFSGLSLSNGRVYVVTHDSTVYAFALPDAPYNRVTLALRLNQEPT